MDQDEYLSPSEEYVSTSFNRPGDLMRVLCRAGYKVTKAESATKNDVHLDEVLGAGLLIEDKLKNTAVIICTKQ